jgi:hypothetical protein
LPHILAYDVDALCRVTNCASHCHPGFKNGT